MGEEGGEPIYGQAQGFRAERLPRQLFVDILHRRESKILTLICFGTNIQGRTFCDAIFFAGSGIGTGRSSVMLGEIVTVQQARILFSGKARAAQKRSIHRLCEHSSSTATQPEGKRRVVLNSYTQKKVSHEGTKPTKKTIILVVFPELSLCLSVSVREKTVSP